MVRRNCKFFSVLLLLLAFVFVIQEHAFASEPSVFGIEYGRNFYDIFISQDGKPDYSNMHSGDAYIYLHSNSDYHEQYAGVKGTLVVVSADEYHMGRKELLDFVYGEDISYLGLDSGDVIQWYFPSHTELNGKFTMPASKDIKAKTTPSFMPYVELISSDKKFTSVRWRFISADMSSNDIASLGTDASISPSVSIVNITVDHQVLSGDSIVWQYDVIDENLSGDAEFGIMDESVSIPVSYDADITITAWSGDVSFRWNFYFNGNNDDDYDDNEYILTTKSSDFTVKFTRIEAAEISSDGTPIYNTWHNNSGIELNLAGKLSYDIINGYPGDRYEAYLLWSDDENNTQTSQLYISSWEWEENQDEMGGNITFSNINITFSNIYDICELENVTVQWEVRAYDRRRYNNYVVIGKGTKYIPSYTALRDRETLLRTYYFPYVEVNTSGTMANSIKWGLVKAISEDWQSEDDDRISYLGYPVSYDKSGVLPSLISAKSLNMFYSVPSYSSNHGLARRIVSANFSANSGNFASATVNQPYAALQDSGITIEFMDSDDITYRWNFNMYANYNNVAVPSNTADNLKPHYYVSTSAQLINGRSDYKTVNSYSSSSMYLEGKQYVSGDDNVYGQLVGVLVVSNDKTKNGDILRYSREDSGKVRYYSGFDVFDITSRDTIFWEFPQSSDLNGKATVPDIRDVEEQLESYVPYVELQHSGVNVTGIKWGFVSSADEKAELKYLEGVDSMKLTIEYVGSSYDISGNYYNLPRTFSAEFKPAASSYAPSVITFKRWPELAINNITFQYDVGSVTYTWYFEINDSGYYSYDGSLVSDWGSLDVYPPIKLNVGETKKINITLYEYYELSDAYVSVHDLSIISVDESLDIDGNNIKGMTVDLKGLASGRTSINIVANGRYGDILVSLPREVWVLNADGTDPADPSEISSENDPDYNPWIIHFSPVDPSNDSGSNSPTDNLSPNTTNTPSVVPGTNTGGAQPGGSSGNAPVSGLSVTAQAVTVSEAPSAVVDSFKEVLSNIGDNTPVIAISSGSFDTAGAADVATVRNAVSGDLIHANTPQLLAAVVPPLTVSTAGYYLFALDLSHIPSNQRIFWHPDYRRLSVAAADIEAKAEEGYYAFIDKDGNQTTQAGDGNITVATYLAGGKTYNPIVTAEATANDVEIMENTISPNNNAEKGSGPGDSSGGCDAGFSVAGLLMLAGIMMLKKNNA